MNNYSVKKKLFLIFFFTVLIPILTTNTIIYYNIRNNINKEQKLELKSTMERVTYSLDKVIGDCVSISNQLYKFKVVDDFISENYNEPIDFFNEYFYLLQSNFLRYYYNSQYEYKITIYTDNSTILNSSECVKLTPQIRESSWYKKFKNSDGKLVVTLDYSEENQYLNNVNGARTISIIRNLDYFSNSYEKILKIDIDYNSILTYILNEKESTNIYVCNNDYILFSNDSINSKNEQFKSIDFIQRKDVFLENEYRVKGSKEVWNIIVTSDKDIFSRIFNTTKSGYAIFYLITLNLLLPTIIILLVSYSITSRLSLLCGYLDMVKKEDFLTIDINPGKDEIGAVINSYNLMTIKIKELIEVVFRKSIEQHELEIAKNRAELRALQSQVNPHFMFNTLETIRMRSLIKEENETSDIIASLAKLLRQTINWGEDNISIIEELNFVENYLNIQKYRFGDRLTFNVNILDQCKDILIPKLSILTFIENACVHGVEGVSYNVVIDINLMLYEEVLYIYIMDTGKGIKGEKLNEIKNKIKNVKFENFDGQSSIGILNTIMRLQKYCDNTMDFKIESNEENGTIIKIQIPMEKVKRRM